MLLSVSIGCCIMVCICQRAKGGTLNGDPYSMRGYIMGILRLYT